MARDKDLRKATEQTLGEWEGVIRRQKLRQRVRDRHADELIGRLEATERRTGKNLKNFKDALKRDGKKRRPS